MIITFYKTDKQGYQRYYTIHDRQSLLFNRISFLAIWGKGLHTGQEKLYTFDNREEMNKKLQYIVRAKVRQGYKMLYGFSRDQKQAEIIKRYDTMIS